MSARLWRKIRNKFNAWGFTLHIRSACACAALFLAVGAGSALAGAVPYPDTGTPNPVTYTFTATSTGDVTAYFTGKSGASYSEDIGLVGGAEGLNNQTSSQGESLDLGSVTAGQSLVFYDQIFTTGNTWYSDPAQNSDGGNHIYSTTVTAGQVYAGSPAGTYVGFEDEAFPGADYNYTDIAFIFTDVTASVPEPATWAIMLVGLAGLGAVMRRRRMVPASA